MVMNSSNIKNLINYAYRYLDLHQDDELYVRNRLLESCFMEEYDEDDYEDEFLSLEELLVCIVTENLYILIWPKPYYILDRRCFEEGKDAEFRAFIEEHARIIEA